MTATINTVCFEASKLECGSSPEKISIEDTSQFWASSAHLDLDPDMVGNPGSNCLLPIIAGYEATVEAFLQTVSSNECICGSKRHSDDTT